jgi:hypothetical protein
MVTTNKLVPISLSWYWNKAVGKDYLLYAEPVWMQETKSTDILEKSIRDWTELQLNIDIQKGFISVRKASFKEVIVAFDSEKWLKENFLKEPKVTFELPRTFIWYFKKSLPPTLTSHVQWNFLKPFIELRFKEFLKTNKNAVFSQKLKILKKANYEWFTYDADLQMNKITVMLKTSVLFALLVGTSMAKSTFTGKDPWIGKNG